MKRLICSQLGGQFLKKFVYLRGVFFIYAGVKFNPVTVNQDQIERVNWA